MSTLNGLYRVSTMRCKYYFTVQSPTINVIGRCTVPSLRQKTFLHHHYLYNGIMLLYKIFSNYRRRNLQQTEQVLCNITTVCVNIVTFCLWCAILKWLNTPLWL